MRPNRINIAAIALCLAPLAIPADTRGEEHSLQPASTKPIQVPPVSELPSDPIEVPEIPSLPGGPCLSNDRPRSTALGAYFGGVGAALHFDGSFSEDRDGTIISYRWQFGDGTIAYGSNVSHVFQSPGVYPIMLEVIDDCGQSDIDLFIDTVGGNACDNNRLPIAAATTDQPAEVFELVSFNGTDSRDPDGWITRYRWEFGDGVATGWINNSTISHGYAAPGTYIAKLTVMDNCYGQSPTITFPVNITDRCANNVVPIAEPGPDRTVDAGVPLLLDASASTDPDGTITAYWWNFGDDQFTGWQTSPTAAHTYSEPGNYVVTLWVKDDCDVFSLPESFILHVVESDPCSGNVSPVANAAGDEAGETGQVLNFNGSGSMDVDGGIAAMEWTFGDGRSAEGEVVTHIYEDPGDYTVTVSVTDTCGGMDQDSLIVHISAPDPCADNQSPVAEAGPDVEVHIGTQIDFDGSASTDADGQVVAYWWMFGDGQSTNWQSSATVPYTYVQTGIYTATLWVRDDCGAMSEIDSLQVTILPPDPCANNLLPRANPLVSNSGAEVGSVVGFIGLLSSDPDGVIVAYHWDFGDDQTGTGGVAAHSYTAAGTYQVLLTVTDNCGATNVDDATVIVTGGDPCANNTAPVASAGNDQVVDVGQEVAFSAAGTVDSDGNVVSYAWNYGDNQFGDGLTSAHVYETAGVYTVTIAVTDACGETDTDSALITVNAVDPCAGNQSPFASAGPDQMAIVGASIEFSSAASGDADGFITTYNWSFGDGQFASGVTANHAYLLPGQYTVTVTVMDNCGASAQDTAIMTISLPDPCASNQTPIANAGNDQQVALGNSTVLNGSASIDPNGQIAEYWWNFGDGQFTGWQSSSSTSHTYATAGAFAATLWVKDNCGLVSLPDVAFVTVNAPDPCAGNHAPTASITGGGTHLVGNPVNFIAFASFDSDGSIISYDWTFGDGGIGNGSVVSHIYTAAGVYTTTLTVTDNCGATDSKSVSVTINTPNPCTGNLPPIANAGPNQSGQTGQLISFSSAGSLDPNGTITSYHWNFGDGQTGMGATTTHAYSNSGVFTVTLTVTDNCGATGQDTAQVTVTVPDPCAGNHAPFASAGPDIAGQTNQTLMFLGVGSADSDGTITSYHWNFGDGQSAMGLSVLHAFTTAGNFTVTLTVTDNCGATHQDTAVATITIPDPCSGNVPPTANAGPDSQSEMGVPVSFSAAGSSDPNGTITAYWWNFGDGQSTGWIPSGNVQHTYTSASTFIASLWVRDNCGASSSPDTANVTIINDDPCAGNAPPVAQVTGPSVTQVGQSVSFSGTGSTDANNNIVSYSWAFGDGGFANGANVNHTYTTPGQYSVVLTVTDSCGAIDTETHSITVLNVNPGDLEAILVASIAVGTEEDGDIIWQEIILDADHPIDIGTTVRFDGTPSTGAAFYVWELAPGVIVSGPIQTYKYNAVGCFNITLTVYDAGGTDSDTTGGTVCVRRAMTFLDSLPLADQNANDLAIDNGIGWISHSNNVLTAFNASNPNDLILISATSAPTGRAIAAANNKVYLCSGTQGVHIYQATLPTPTFLGTYNTASVDSQRAQDAIIIGKVMYLAAGVAGIKVLDLQQAPTISVLGVQQLPNATSADIIKVKNGIAYVTDNTGKIFLYDVSAINPQNPVPGPVVLRSTVNHGFTISHTSVNNVGVLAVYAPPEGLCLYGVGDPSNPGLLGCFDLTDDSFGLHASGILATDSHVYAGFGNVLGFGTSVARINTAVPSDMYVMEWLSMSNYVSGSNRSPILMGNIIYWANSTYNAVTMHVTTP